ncbi:MAG TPA: ribbon-helix-helix domain-containing protein [Desulfomonilaceae bacterium]|nr:ribbon-helix-helix domain-containing protein [Desulfomonilaceae bacterium]
MKKEKLDIITFKVPESLRDAMKGIPNRSEFIRAAVVAALDSICPLCKGTGVIMPNQRQHWDMFANDHHFIECETCNAVHVVCDHSSQEFVHVHETD